MKTLLTLVAILSMSVVTFAGDLGSEEIFKSSTGFELKYSYDVMEDEESLRVLNGFKATEDGKTGMIVFVSFKKDGGEWVYNGLVASVAGVGSCHENSELLFLLEDGTKPSTRMWEDFSCEGQYGFDLYDTMAPKLASSPVKAIRITNGRSYEKYTYMPKTKEEKEYFINALKALEEFKSQHSKSSS